MGEYDSLVKVAKSLIAKKGQSVTWTTTVNGAAPDPEKPYKDVPTTDEEHTVKIAFLPNERYGRELFRYFKGTDIPVGNLLGYMAQVPFIPTLKDTVIRNGKTLPILSFNAFDPNGEGVILYAIEFDGITSV